MRYVASLGKRSAFTASALVVLSSVVAISFARRAQSAHAALFGVSLLQLAIVYAIYRALEPDVAGWHRKSPAGVGVTALAALPLALLPVLALTLRGSPAFPAWQVLWLLPYQFLLIALPEELLFRGIVFSIFGQRSWQALLVSSAFFSLYHCSLGLRALPYYFAAGCVLGTFRRFGLPLLPLVAGHGLFNSVVAVWAPAGFRFGEGAFYSVAPAMLVTIAALAGWILSVLEERRKQVLWEDAP